MHSFNERFTITASGLEAIMCDKTKDAPQFDQTERCLKACGDLIAPIITANPQTFGDEILAIARNEGWAIRTTSDQGGDRAGFKAWLIEIIYATWLPNTDQFRAIVDSIDAVLDVMVVEPYRVKV